MIEPVIDIEKITKLNYRKSAKSLSLKHLYDGYAYPKKSGTLTIVKEDTDHPYSITFEQFRMILECYFKHWMLYVLQGFNTIVPWQCGMVKAVRSGKFRTLDDETMQKIWEHEDTLTHTLKYNYVTIWSQLRNGRLLKFRFATSFMHKYYREHVKKNPSLITNLDKRF